MHMLVAYPPGYAPNAEVVAAAEHAISIVASPEDAVKYADVVYTDTWISIGDEAEAAARMAAFADYQVNDALMSKAPAHALIMHCLPAHRDVEISSSVLDSPNSVVFDQAENRKHLQKYLAAWILGCV
jgi:ornithine carbamoyltransferase